MWHLCQTAANAFMCDNASASNASSSPPNAWATQHGTRWSLCCHPRDPEPPGLAGPAVAELLEMSSHHFCFFFPVFPGASNSFLRRPGLELFANECKPSVSSNGKSRLWRQAVACFQCGKKSPFKFKFSEELKAHIGGLY